MDQIIAKLTNLSYELFGVFIPGVIFLLFLAWWYWCAADLGPLLTFGYLAPLRFESVQAGDLVFPDEIKLGFVVYVGVVAYFLGHLLNWFGRIGSAEASIEETKLKRAQENLGNCLRLAVPKSRQSYFDSLQSLLDEGYRFLEIPDTSRSWNAFYLVAKSRISQELSRSLISTFQNKYTLHRALTVAAVIWFWLTIFLIWGGVTLAILRNDQGPHWAPLLLSLPISLLTIWGFSESYRFHWTNWGNSVIAETFMLSRKAK